MDSVLKMVRVVIVILIAILVACSPQEVQPTPSPTAHAGQVHGSLDGIGITLYRPAGWQAYISAEHILLSERSRPYQADGLLEGIVINVWKPDLSDLPEGEHAAQEVLQHVIEHPQMQQSAATSPLTAFAWDGHDAAYYTLNSGDGNMTLVVAVMVDNVTMLAVNVSAPAHDADRMREMLPHLFGDFSVNGKMLDVTALEELPHDLEIPHYQSEARGTPVQ